MLRCRTTPRDRDPEFSAALAFGQGRAGERPNQPQTIVRTSDPAVAGHHYVVLWFDELHEYFDRPHTFVVCGIEAFNTTNHVFPRKAE